MKQVFAVVVGAFLLAVVAVAPASAAVPDTISFQGRLTDTDGALLNGTYSVTLRIYDAASGGSLLWTEAHPSVAVVNGIHNVYLGSITTLSGLVFDRPYWISIEVNGGGEMTPRRPMTTAPYAFRAKYADTVAGVDTNGLWSVGVGNAIYRAASNVGIGTATPGDSLTVAGTMSVDSPTFVVNATNNRVGINTAAPSSALEVTGNILGTTLYNTSGIGLNGVRLHNNKRLDGDVGIHLQDDTGAGAGDIHIKYYYPLRVYQSFTGLVMTLDQWGNLYVDSPTFVVNASSDRVGIGLTSPSYPLHLASGAYVTVGGVWTNASSRSLKHDITNLSSDDYAALLAELDRIDVVRYRYNAENTGEEHLGVIAEDAPEELVTPDRTGVPTGDAIGYLLGVSKALLEQNRLLMERLKLLEERLPESGR